MSEGRLACVGGDRQIWVMGMEAQSPRQVTFGEGPGARNPWGVLQSRDHSSLPCWSPDGRWVSCFQTQMTGSESGQMWLSIVEVDGVEEQRLVVVEEGYPIYAQWSPDSQRVAILTQEQEHLSLGVCTLGEMGEYRLMEAGIPLFFSWTTDSGRLLIHSGSEGDTRLVVRDVLGGTPDEVFVKQPGNFCTPLVMRKQAVFVGRDEGHGVICVSDWSGSGVQGIAAIEGLVAMVGSPDGRSLAFTSAPPGGREPYQGLWVADMETGELNHICDEKVVAYFWLPDSSGLIFAGRGRGPAEFQWNAIERTGGPVRPLVRFFPSLDQKFYLHFFEQFAVSHSLVSADGKRLVFSSHPDPRGGGSDSSPHICSVDLEAEEPKTEVLVPGEFAVCSP
jgi:Tol biopolymer transport system component